MSVGHYENFPVGSLMLPRRLRKPVHAIYAFARSADDIADEGHADAATRLRQLAELEAELNTISRGETPQTALMQRLQRELTKRFFLQGNEKILITFSAGVAQATPTETGAELIRRADQGMYLAKRAGKNRVMAA